MGCGGSKGTEEKNAHPVPPKEENAENKQEGGENKPEEGEGGQQQVNQEPNA